MMKMSPKRIKTATICTVAVALMLPLFFISGCGSGGGANVSAAEKSEKAAELVAKGVRPNEMGMVMLLEYHRIADQERDYVRSIDNFKKDLETLYQKGFRLVKFSDLLSGKVSTPAGTTPVVFTFDDSVESQFRYIKQGANTVIDPNCALGMMQEFSKKHPDFGYTAEFNYLPDLFEQPEYVKQKVEYLQTNGFEFGDHTVSHPSLGTVSDEKVQQEIADPIKKMQSVDPKVKVDILCLPNGSIPKNQALMYDGTSGGTKYHLDWSLLVGSNPMYMQYHYKNPGKLLPRIQCMDYNAQKGSGAQGSGYWLNYFEKHPETRFVSDGDPTTICAPAYMESRLLKEKLPSGMIFVGY